MEVKELQGLTDLTPVIPSSVNQVNKPLSNVQKFASEHLKKEDRVLVCGGKKTSAELKDKCKIKRGEDLSIFSNNKSYEAAVISDKFWRKNILSEKQNGLQKYVDLLKPEGKIFFNLKGLKQKEYDKSMKNILLCNLKPQINIIYRENNQGKPSIDLEITATKIRVSSYVRKLASEHLKEGDSVLVLGEKEDETVSYLKNLNFKVTFIKNESEEVIDLNSKDTFKAVIGTYSCSNLKPEFFENVLKKHADKVVYNGWLISRFACDTCSLSIFETKDNSSEIVLSINNILSLYEFNSDGNRQLIVNDKTFMSVMAQKK